MQDVLDESLKKLKKFRIQKTRMIAILLVLSLIVSLDVFWWMRRPGLTLAGDADCEIVEHTHDGDCGNGESCSLAEHVHDISCYSNDKADVETQLDWQSMFANYPYTGDLRKDLVGIAKMQVGYTESKENFQVGSDGVRRGYNRYGAWYGTPYSDWSAPFVSFCLHYAGADLSVTPANTGANAMAQAWKKLDKYADVGDYAPVSGDLVFFDNNTVGIVTDINAFTFCVIRGDVDGAVRSDALVFTDPSIAGWGVTTGTAQGEDTSYSKIYDVENGPAVFIFDGIAVQKPTLMQPYSLKATRSFMDISPYLAFITLVDTNNHYLPKDDNGNYIAHAETAYKLTLSFSSPRGFVPGTYQYQLPDGLRVDGGDGTFVLSDGTHVGDWTVTEDGVITFNFNDNINNRTEVTISATMGVSFDEQNDSIDFDGNLHVTILPPYDPNASTKVEKWGSQGDPTKGQDPSKIYWQMKITGRTDSVIVGSVITDWLTTDGHTYTQSDIDAGLTIGASQCDPVTWSELNWYSWDVHVGDPNLTWTETGWTYTMPSSVYLNGNYYPVQLGNNGWIYYISYTTTPDPNDTAGNHWHTNDVTVDGQHEQGGSNFVHGEVVAGIDKHGSFHGDANGGYFLWEMQATIPGRKDGEKSTYEWYIQDTMTIVDQSGNRVAYTPNDMHLATITANYHGKTINVPRIQDATENDPYAWLLTWSNNEGVNDFYYTRQILILSRCDCTAESCSIPNGCWTYGYTDDDGVWHGSSDYCYCWTETENTTFTLTYKTEDMSVMDKYGGKGYSLNNWVMLLHSGGALADDDSYAVPIPTLVEKELTHEYDGHTAHYKITVNEGKLVLTDGSPLTIHDVMTDTLAYIAGSLVITAEDANGNVTTLNLGEDYTVTYDGTGTQKDENGKTVHVLDIVIKHPQPVTYVLDYDATLVLPEGEITEAIKYTNSATISLWGQQISDNTTEKVYADINIAARNYKVEIFKNCTVSGDPLMGATFGLFNAHDGLITSAVTDADGKVEFETNVINGIILLEHELYYIQEISAPTGYQLDDTKFWFCFCNGTEDTCETFAEISAGKDVQRVPLEQVGKLNVSNHPLNYDLPATGGSGVYPLMLASVIFIITPLVYRFTLRRKRERGLGG